MSSLVINLHQQYAGNLAVPDLAQFENWATATLKPNLNYELAIVLVDEQYSNQLNYQFRGKNYPTNVLSFVSDDYADMLEIAQLGDLIICVPIVHKEASAQQKDVFAHFAHLVIHGCLHLLGFDHENENDAQIMESRECELMRKLNLPNPYA